MLTYADRCGFALRLLLLPRYVRRVASGPALALRATDLRVPPERAVVPAVEPRAVAAVCARAARLTAAAALTCFVLAPSMPFGTARFMVDLKSVEAVSGKWST